MLDNLLLKLGFKGHDGKARPGNLDASGNLKVKVEDTDPVKVQVSGTIAEQQTDLLSAIASVMNGSVNIYDGGVDGYKFVEGYSKGEGEQSKELDHLYLKVEGNQTTTGVRTYVTEEPIDLTHFDYITINFDMTGDVYYNAFDLLVGGEKYDDQTIYEKRLRFIGSISGTQVLDVSDVIGEKYIKVVLVDTKSGSAHDGEVKVYSITAKSKYERVSKVVKAEKQIKIMERTGDTDVQAGEIFPKVEVEGEVKPKIEYNGYTIIDNLEWQTNTKSDMWFRVMVKVDGEWTLWNHTIESDFSLGSIYNPERIVNGNSLFEILEFDDNKEFYKFAIRKPIIAPEGIQIYFENRSATNAYKAGIAGVGRVLLQ